MSELQGEYSNADHLCRNSSIMATRYTVAHFDLLFSSCDTSLVIIFFFNFSVFFSLLFVLFKCLELNQEIKAWFLASKTGLRLKHFVC